MARCTHNVTRDTNNVTVTMFAWTVVYHFTMYEENVTIISNLRLYRYYVIIRYLHTSFFKITDKVK